MSDNTQKPITREIKDKYQENDDRHNSIIERIFERGLWSTRFIVILAVIASVFVSLCLFIIGTVDITGALADVWRTYIQGNHDVDIQTEVIGTVIGAVVVYLIGVALLIFSFGIYQLFISQIDPAAKSESSDILEIKNLDDLKDRLAQVIIIALIVKFFQIMITFTFDDIWQMGILAGSVLALSLAIYFMHKKKGERHSSAKDAPKSADHD